jgi:hypothetical protein
MSQFERNMLRKKDRERTKKERCQRKKEEGVKTLGAT